MARRTPIPRVPLQTAMFEQGPDGAPRLTRTWIIFFERLAAFGVATVIGWDVVDSTPALDVSDPVIPVSDIAITNCQIRIKVTDPANPFEIDIRRNGKSIFKEHPVIPAGTATRDIHKFTGFIDPNLVIHTGDDVVLDIVQGGAWEVAVYLVSQ